MRQAIILTGRELPNKEFRKLVKASRDPEFKKEIYENQKPREINWSEVFRKMIILKLQQLKKLKELEQEGKV